MPLFYSDYHTAFTKINAAVFKQAAGYWANFNVKEQLGIGTDLPLEHIPVDPLDPYDLSLGEDAAELQRRADL